MIGPLGPGMWFTVNGDDLHGLVKVGDTVLICGEVRQISPGVGLLVGLVSKTDQYDAWVRGDKVAAVLLPDPPPEPADQTWLRGPEYKVFIRDDENAPEEDDRRWPRHWYDQAAGDWIDWPTAFFTRGADPQRQMQEHVMPGRDSHG